MMMVAIIAGTAVVLIIGAVGYLVYLAGGIEPRHR
jgi:preprotein translocase subunit Sss1